MSFNRVFRERALQRRGRQEPLDDRLQITAPHERLIVAGLCVTVLALMAFSVFGRVERTVSLEAALVLPGEGHEVVAFISPGDAASLSAGMEARVSFGGPDDGGRQVFQGQVEEVSARPGRPPKWLADQGLAMPQQAHLLRVALAGDEPDVPLGDGAAVSLSIVLGRESLVSCLASGSGG